MIKILCLGKVKESYLRDGMDEFIKRLSKFTKLEIIELKDEKILSNSSKIKEVEGTKLLNNISSSDYVACLDSTGKSFSSEMFSEFLTKDSRNIVFVIGGALGLGKNILSRADIKISLSNMTFTHQMVRLFLLEQVYRGFTIKNNIKYHK